jgi:hypothetical protein
VLDGDSTSKLYLYFLESEILDLDVEELNVFSNTRSEGLLILQMNSIFLSAILYIRIQISVA